MGTIGHSAPPLSMGPERSSVGLGQPLRIANWLWAVASLVVVIVFVGGITRLTESGLSITQWQPVTGTLPPLSEAAWEAEFARYRQTGEYIYESGPAGMTLADFKFIYFWEWFHRLLGRLIGLAYALPLAWFWVRGAIPGGYKPRLLFLLGLGGLQGLFGWLMVRSGLSTDMTDVSHFWLSVHLCTALLTLALLVWTALDMRALARNPGARQTVPSHVTALGWGVAAVIALQILLGAWVAGLNAGHASDSWPLMHGSLVPGFDTSRGLLWAVTHDPFLLHFLHRWWAWAAVIAVVVLARRVRMRERRASIALHSALGTMVLLGIGTVISGVELWVAVAHQLVGALLVAALAWALHVDGRRVGEPAA
jgi:cytochrome c oxidase assembly protein subunit 15